MMPRTMKTSRAAPGRIGLLWLILGFISAFCAALAATWVISKYSYLDFEAPIFLALCVAISVTCLELITEERTETRYSSTHVVTQEPDWASAVKPVESSAGTTPNPSPAVILPVVKFDDFIGSQHPEIQCECGSLNSSLLLNTNCGRCLMPVGVSARRVILKSK